MSDKAAEIVKAAVACVRPGGGLVAENFPALVKAVTEYCATNDPNAAKRNRDEHGPDIPTQDLDWRSRL